MHACASILIRLFLHFGRDATTSSINQRVHHSRHIKVYNNWNLIIISCVGPHNIPNISVQQRDSISISIKIKGIFECKATTYHLNLKEMKF